MLRFTLTRQLGTPFYTLGVLEEPTTGFRCKTLERPVEETRKNPRKHFVAIPAGVYMLKVVALDTDFTIGFSLNGSWRYADLRGDASFSGIPAGSICIGKSFNEETGLVGAEEVGKRLSKLIEYLIDSGVLSGKSKKGEMMIEIVQDESFVITKGKKPDASKGKRTKLNWDCLEEDGEEDLGIEWEDE